MTSLENGRAQSSITEEGCFSLALGTPTKPMVIQWTQNLWKKRNWTSRRIRYGLVHSKKNWKWLDCVKWLTPHHHRSSFTVGASLSNGSWKRASNNMRNWCKMKWARVETNEKSTKVTSLKTKNQQVLTTDYRMSDLFSINRHFLKKWGSFDQIHDDWKRLSTCTGDVTSPDDEPFGM